MKYPKPLMKKNTIGLIAPAGPLRNIKVEEIKYELNKLGYKVKIGKSCYLSYKGYLSGIGNTLKFTIISNIVKLIPALMIAIMLQEGLRGEEIGRAHV